jgi:hypothetical protein
MGANTTASGNSSTAIGANTTASGNYSTAMGSHVSTDGHDGSFVIGDNSSGINVTNSSANNQFTARFAGGYALLAGQVGIGTSSPVAKLDVYGDLAVRTGAFRGELGPGGGAPFPRPAYNSGWVYLSKSGGTQEMTHNLGGNVDDYVVEVDVKGSPSDGAIRPHYVIPIDWLYDNVKVSCENLYSEGLYVRARIWITK